MNRDDASRGGRSTVERHGVGHMSEIGRKGFAATVARHYQGDAGEYLRVQRRRAAEAGVEGFVSRLMDERLEKGESIVCMELPVILDPDDEPW